MMVLLKDVKSYLRLEQNEDDELLQIFVDTAENLCQDIVRFDLSTIEILPEEVKTAILYCVTYLYENRENADYKELTMTLKYLLFGLREESF